jgi:hypothetical protein
MSYSMSVRFKAEPLRSLAFGSIGATYMGLGTSFVHPIRLIFLQNLTNQLLLFSLDGINDHIVLPPSGFLLLDITSNKTREQGWYIAEGDRIYVKEDGAAPTTGGVALSAFYGSDLGS